jgi:phosphoesterase RecJ-like protein
VIEVPPHRRETARSIAERLDAARSIAVATHVRGDGDGWGSAAAIAHHYAPQGTDVRLLAATPFPDRFRFLLPAGLQPLGPGARGRKALSSADAQVLVDVSEPTRLGDFEDGLAPGRTIVIDHHPRPSVRLQWAAALIDPDAAATVELIYDVLVTGGRPITTPTALALYVGLVTDTGSFRYSNVGARTHRLAAELIAAGIDAQDVYNRLHGTVSDAELATLKAALDGLQRDPDLPITWLSLDYDLARRHGELDEYERVLEHARNLEGTEVALMFRELADGSVKVSLRSNGPANVASVARSFGGGGHEKAAGAVVEGELDDVEARILDACRAELRAVLPDAEG